MFGIEIDMVTADSRAALKFYEKIFDVKRIEATDYEKGLNEAVFTVYGTRFHILDENHEYQLFAPDPKHPQSVWFNVLVEDIEEVWQKAADAGCTAVQPVTEIPEMGCSNAMFTDPFGYMWMLHQIHREVSFEERCAAVEKIR